MAALLLAFNLKFTLMSESSVEPRTLALKDISPELNAVHEFIIRQIGYYGTLLVLVPGDHKTSNIDVQSRGVMYFAILVGLIERRQISR